MTLAETNIFVSIGSFDVWMHWPSWENPSYTEGVQFVLEAFEQVQPSRKAAR